jgi:CMP-N,N'-diacetyllegionaminic acid synthase
MDAIAIILARAGSKGVPGKNHAAVGGKPCIAWTIDAARASRTVSRTIVSTDDPGIAAIARGYGAETIDRPADLASDTARVDEAARHAVMALDGRSRLGRAISLSSPLVLLYANVPVRPSDLIDRAVTMLVESGCDSVQSYAPVGKHHPWWTARLDPASGAVRPWEGDVLNHGVYRRQELPPAHIPDGGVIALTRRALMLEIPGVAPGPHAFFGLDRRGVVNPEGAVVDIDSPLDLLVADALLRQGPPKATMPA